jgi:hypothetical protein
MKNNLIATAVILLLLTSCDSYQRNYSGPLLPSDGVGYLFNDSRYYGSLCNKEGGIIHTASLPVSNDPIIHLLNKEVICREILPGSYSIEAWIDERHAVGPRGRTVTRKRGPYTTQFEAEAGKIYCVRENRIPQESRFFFLSFTEYLSEVKILDVSEVPKYQEFVNNTERR